MGSKIELACEGNTWIAELFEDKAPKTCKAILDSLPLEGQLTITNWSGAMLRLWVDIPEPAEGENAGVLQFPGDILFIPRWNGLRIVYGQAQMGGPGGPSPTPKVGKIVEGDLDALSELAKRVDWEGTRTMTVKKA